MLFDYSGWGIGEELQEQATKKVRVAIWKAQLICNRTQQDVSTF